MANNLNASPLYIDTVMATGAGLGRLIQVKKIAWFNPTAVGNKAVITDTNSGAVLWEAIAAAANQGKTDDFVVSPLILPPGFQNQNDWKVSQLDSGVVFIYPA